MKKYFWLIALILFIAPVSIYSGTNATHHKILLKGEVSDEGTTKTSDEEPIDIYIEGTDLNFYFYSKSEFKIEIYNSANALKFSQTVSKYGGKVLSVNIANWASGSYKIVITNVTHSKTATADFSL